MLHEKYGDTIEFQYEKGIHDAAKEDEGYSSFRLRKLKGAPIELPFLDVKTVSETAKWTPENKKDNEWHLK